MATFHLKIIAYDKIFYDDEAVSIVLPAVDGEIQIMANHEEYVIALKEGEVRIMTSDGKMIPAVCGSRAREAKERVEERMRQHQSKMEYHRNAASLARAMARLKEANKYRH